MALKRVKLFKLNVHKLRFRFFYYLFGRRFRFFHKFLSPDFNFFLSAVSVVENCVYKNIMIETAV